MKTATLTKTDPIRGKTIQFMFDDGPMANKTFEHEFDEQSGVTFRQVDSNAKSNDAKDVENAQGSSPTKYEVATVRDDVWVVSYLSSSGYTLTTVLDFKTKKLVAFASNDKMLAVQRGTFREIARPSHKAERVHASTH